MVNSKHCTICRHYGLRTEEGHPLEVSSVYDELGNKVPLNLCKEHSTDLFRMGQRRFLMSHYKILIDLVDTDNMKFIEILKDTVKKNVHAL